MSTAEMKERMLMHAAEVRTSPREAFAQFIREDLARWAKLIKASGLRSPGG
jgi:tripartite-type tricarboxylate transporter receptor subunit TctC